MKNQAKLFAGVSAFTIMFTSVLFVGAILFFASFASAANIPTCNIGANPPSLSATGSTTLFWSSTDATSASLNNGIGSVGTNGSWYISTLSSDRTYTLTVSGLGGSRTCSVTIPVGTTTTSAPTCSLNATSGNVNSGTASTLSWSTTNANYVSISSIGSVSTSGSQAVYPSTTTTYTLNASGSNGTATCTRTIVVNGTASGMPTCTLSAQPQYVFPNGSAVLSYRTTNATSAWIDGGVGAISLGYGTEVISNVTAPRTYTMTVSNSYGTQSCTANIALSEYSGATSEFYPYNSNYRGAMYAYPYLDYEYPTNYYGQYAYPSANSQYAYSSPNVYTTATAAAYPAVSLGYLPYTGTEDVLYVLIMASLALGAGYIAWRKRAIVLN